jgi:glyoxylase-like metal-dependent hydrolase (beta-lactamase superfamily II)
LFIVLFTITPILLATAMNEKSLQAFRRDYGVKIEVSMHSILLRSETETILIDTGPPLSESGKGIVFNNVVLKDPVPITTALRNEGVEPASIEKIIMTHLHWDHAYNMENFPNAEFYIQKSELSYSVCPMPMDEVMYSASKGETVPDWFKIYHQIKRLDGDTELVPGVKLLLTSGHSPGHQSVLIDTKEGVYLYAGDHYPLYLNWEEMVPNNVHTNFKDWYDSYEKTKNIADFVLPGQYMRVRQRKI